ncbi:uncharacterized protein LOC132175370 isoform X2 [Corylus avellana]|uniref:uncharacterized protein LOC132175370 isoform X2 n=1 Tax=Corylus avellana TaxID=13451 RepID=UPI00286C7862|nr:uncharacterized protein LOC132175370 isoform X2 [Corylus avellana]
MSAPKAKLLCNFGGELTRQLGRVSYVGGKTRLVLVDRSLSFEGLRSKMIQLSCVAPSCIEIKFQLPDETLDSRLVSVECDDDVVAMLSEFEASQRIPLYLFDTGAELFLRENGTPVVQHTVIDGPTSTHGEIVVPIDPQEFIDAEDDLVSLPRDGDDVPEASQDSQNSPSISELVNGRESQTLAVGQEFPDAQAFRSALVAIAIAMKFELTFIRSDRVRVTAKCASDGCSWRIHASKVQDVETFQIKTLRGEHSCARPERSSHRQANMKWILSCIMDRVRENINYKPKEIMRDIELEYGVLIPYLKAHRARERALELILGMPIKDIVFNHAQVQGVENVVLDVLDRQRKKPFKGSSVHCNLCKKIGHNRRSCMKLSQNDSQAEAGSLKEKTFRCMLCKQIGHNRRTCQSKVKQMEMN